MVQYIASGALGAEECSLKAQMSALGIPQIAVVHGISVAGALKTSAKKQ